jgi:DNA (cytosine-5)-methyltransferase 1
MSRRPIAVDLFSGAGGLSLGFEQAGFDVRAAVEIDPIHAAIHKFNFPHCVVLPCSVSELSGKDIRSLSGIGNQRVDVVFGGAPCQGFSLIGKRALEDLRNLLVKDFFRIVIELDSSYFVFENVKGLTVGKHRGFLEELIGAFESHGYQIRLPWKVLNASFYGVPQNRERLFLIGAKKDLALPDYPEPSTIPADFNKKINLSLPIGPSCEDALGDLPEVENFKKLLKKDSVQTENWGTPSKYGREMRCLDISSWHFGYQRLWNSKLLTSSMRTNHTDISRARFQATNQGEVEPVSRFLKLPATGVANTLRAGTDSARGAFTSPRPIHYKTPRCITVREMARLHGFPDWFRFHHTKWHGARQIGNAVPPPLARAVALTIIKSLGTTPIIPDDVLELGESKLLFMDMTEASNYWDISVPIKPRDRKTNIKKSNAEEEIVLKRQDFLKSS